VRSILNGMLSLSADVLARWGQARSWRGGGLGIWIVLLVLGAAGMPTASGQLDLEEEPLLPEMIGSQDIEMRARYVRQWRQDDGTLVVMFSGDFRLNVGLRQLSANDAIVWIVPKRSEPDGRKYYELTVYLSESAGVREPGGTTTEDDVLLVSNLRTYGRLIKHHDAHSPEAMEDSRLYQRAVRDRARIEEERAVAPGEAAPLEVARPEKPERPERPPPTIRWNLSNVDAAETPDGQVVQVATGGVYFSRSGGLESAVLEIRADSAVVFLAEGATTVFGGELKGEAQQPVEPEEAAPERPPSPPIERPERQPTAEEAGFGVGAAVAEEIEAVYLEGDVVLTLGNRFVRARRLYYDFQRDRALILDAVFRADLPERGIPLYVRAAEIRQLSAREFSARNARVSTSEFYTPHYHVGAERVCLRDRTPRDAAGRPTARIAGTYELRNATLNVGNVPFLWWPYAKGDFETSETLIRRFAAAYSDDFGVSVETAWYLFNLLGVRPPEGFDATFHFDYFSRRGPGVGIDTDYERAVAQLLHL
jgi:hypothetical protein